jgi:hypothetical protein
MNPNDIGNFKDRFEANPLLANVSRRFIKACFRTSANPTDRFSIPSGEANFITIDPQCTP